MSKAKRELQLKQEEDRRERESQHRIHRERERFRKALYDTMNGSARRAAIMEWLTKEYSSGLVVNRRYHLQVKEDRDLQRLIKEGKLKLTRNGRRYSKISYLVKA